MEFTKCQGCQLLTSIPASARQTLHHFEVAAVLDSFQARPPLPVGRYVPQKSFVYVVVTDWSVLVVSIPSSKAGPMVLLEVPLLLIQYMVRYISSCCCVEVISTEQSMMGTIFARIHTASQVSIYAQCTVSRTLI